MTRTHPSGVHRLLGTTSTIVLLAVAAGCSSTRLREELVDVQQTIPGIVLDIRYATTNNFTGQQLYPFSKCYLRRAPAEKLRAAQAELATLGCGLKIFDGYRPLSVQRKMWEVFPQPGYVADPKKGSRHNRGAAVDVTLIRLADGTELPMPTPYDDFTERAHRNFADLPEDAIRNRELLDQVLTKHGFVGLPTEWWHFDDSDWRKYPLLDITVPPAR
jgi:zinc D-Ala-D-Ala dipeptidase